MYKNRKIIALIPARKGSKRLKGKNIRKFNNKKLIEWTFKAVKNSKFVDDIFLSSNDEKIINIADKYKIKIPFKRPNYLSNDKSNANQVVLHFLKWMKFKIRLLYHIKNYILKSPNWHIQ